MLTSTIVMMVKANKSFKAFNIKLGRRIHEIRDERGYSQEYLADLANMDRVSIGYIEQGRRSPKLSTLFIIAKCLKVNVSDFFRDL